jgi:hypothetical protein
MREYIPTFFLLAVGLVGLGWFELYAKPRLKRELWDKEEPPTEAPESHSKSSE